MSLRHTVLHSVIRRLSNLPDGETKRFTSACASEAFTLRHRSIEMLAKLRGSRCTPITDRPTPSNLRYNDEYYKLGDFTYAKNRKTTNENPRSPSSVSQIPRASSPERCSSQPMASRASSVNASQIPRASSVTIQGKTAETDGVETANRRHYIDTALSMHDCLAHNEKDLMDFETQHITDRCEFGRIAVQATTSIVDMSSPVTPISDTFPGQDPKQEETMDIERVMFPQAAQMAGQKPESPYGNFKRKKRYFRAKTVNEEMIEIMNDVFKRHGNRCSEALYQRAVVRRAYLEGLPVMMERELFANYGEGGLLIGRVDVEVASCCLYEFKVGSPNIVKDSEQVNTYLRAYDANNEKIEIASLVYFTKSGVFIHQIRG
jgi:hypothetical protein